MNPKVFVSHASEDKNRFVLNFARRLREKGIDAWLDRWEMGPGDSLIDKIFEEGLKEAKAVIAVLSQYSVNKPWVREELNAAMIKKIEQATKLIPVVIEDCDAPECLKAIMWERISDLDSYDKEFERIVMSIYGHRDKPPLGALPTYATAGISAINGLTKVDSLVLKIACEIVIELGTTLINTHQVLSQAVAFNLPEQEVRDSLEILDQDGYLTLHKVNGGPPPSLTISFLGFDRYVNTYVPSYKELFINVIAKIVNDGLRDSVSIAKSIEGQQLLVDHALHDLENQGYLGLSKAKNYPIYLHKISAKLKRALEGNI